MTDADADQPTPDDHKDDHPDELVDEMVDESFPGSDPPGTWAGPDTRS